MTDARLGNYSNAWPAAIWEALKTEVRLGNPIWQASQTEVQQGNYAGAKPAAMTEVRLHGQPAAMASKTEVRQGNYSGAKPAAMAEVRLRNYSGA